MSSRGVTQSLVLCPKQLRLDLCGFALSRSHKASGARQVAFVQKTSVSRLLRRGDREDTAPWAESVSCAGAAS